MSITTTSQNATDAGPAAGTQQQEKDWLDFLGGVLPGVAGAAAQEIGIDPRIAGQTVSQVLGAFGIGGPGKAFTSAMPRDEALSKLKDVVTPHLGDPGFAPALGAWMQAALEPIKAQQQGKDYTPDLSKSWFSDAVDSVSSAVSGAVSNVNWGQVAQVGMQALPMVLAAL